MRKFFATLFFCITLYNTAFADSYYFKKCQLTEISYGDYIVDLENNIIKVNLTLTNGTTQQFVDKIKFVTKDQIVSEFIQSSKSTNSYFQYYLDAKSKSIIKLKYKKENGIIGLDGPKIQSYCENVKADWDMSKKENIEEKKEAEFKAQQEKELIKAKKKRELELKKKEKEKNYRKISIDDKEWYPLSQASNAPTDHLKESFNEEAFEICSPSKNFDIIEQSVEVIELDETPTFGVETVVRFGIAGIIECK